MKIIPAIDILDNQCVRLTQGAYDQKTIYHDDPVTMAKLFEDQGATHLHLVDLNGAKSGITTISPIIEGIKEQTELNLQVGGGIRTQASIEQILQSGTDKIILGTIAIKDPSFTEECIQHFSSNRVILGLDVKLDPSNTPMCATDGWINSNGSSLWELLDIYNQYPELSVLCTDIAIDGTLRGPNISLYRSILSKYPNLNLLGSGGISQLSDLQQLQKLELSGVIVGKALYEYCFTLQEALEVCEPC